MDKWKIKDLHTNPQKFQFFLNFTTTPKKRSLSDYFRFIQIEPRFLSFRSVSQGYFNYKEHILMINQMNSLQNDTSDMGIVRCTVLSIE